VNVGQLKELLDDYGDHLPVAVVVNKGERDEWFDEFDFGDETRQGEPTVTLTVEL
jgi:hypothetical protein